MKKKRYIITIKNPYIKSGTITWVYAGEEWDGPIERYLNNKNCKVEIEEV
jgi:hypothetical protein